MVSCGSESRSGLFGLRPGVIKSEMGAIKEDRMYD
jgi:hypothetical protein